MSGVDFGDPAVLAALTAALEAAGVDGIEIERPAGNIRIVIEHGAPRTALRHVPDHNRPASPQTGTVNAPIAGLFTGSHPSATAFATVPREVSVGDMLGFVRIGPILLPVRASMAGMLTQVHAADGALVGYGDPLYQIEPRP